MKVLDQNQIRKVLNANKDTIIYNTSHDVILRILKEQKVKEIESTKLSELRDSRPFDEMIISVSAYADNLKLWYYFLVLFNKDGSSDIECVYENGLKADWKNEEEKLTFLKEFYGYTLRLFGFKKSKIYLNEGRVDKLKNGKVKIKKSKYIYISFDKVISESRNKNYKTTSSFLTYQVCGHWRNIKGKVGHDRKGNIINDKTWIKPYLKGEGELIMEKIRVWK